MKTTTTTFVIFALVFSLISINSRTSDPGSHSSRLFSLSPTTVHALEGIFMERRALPSLIDSHRIGYPHERSPCLVGAGLHSYVRGVSSLRLVSAYARYWPKGAPKYRPYNILHRELQQMRTLLTACVAKVGAVPRYSFFFVQIVWIRL